MLLRAYVGGPIGTVAYLVGDEAAGEAIVVDAPGGIARQVADDARRLGVRVVLLVCTHGHWDHVLEVAELHTLADAPVAVHALDAPLLRRPTTAPFPLPIAIAPSEPDRLLVDGDEVAVGGQRFRVLHTPGHTPGSICLYEPTAGALFSGDTLFDNGYGRTDLPGGDDEALRRSLARLAALPAETRVYPGHGSETTIGAQRWLRGLG